MERQRSRQLRTAALAERHVYLHVGVHVGTRDDTLARCGSAWRWCWATASSAQTPAAARSRTAVLWLSFVRHAADSRAVLMVPHVPAGLSVSLLFLCL